MADILVVRVYHLQGFLEKRMNKRNAKTQASALWSLLVQETTREHPRLYLTLICTDPKCGLPYGECMDNRVASSYRTMYMPKQTLQWAIGAHELLSRVNREALEHEEFVQYGAKRLGYLLDWLSFLKKNFA